jgi:hypothetical protein
VNISRRILVSVAAGLLLTGALGATAAEASFSDTADTGAYSLATATVPAPGNFTGTLTCGSSSATMAASWTASTATLITGYKVTVYFSDGYTQTVQKLATDTSWRAPITAYNVTAYSVRYSVTTQTAYGWTTESAKTAWFRC